jgi:hypothetical protein
MAGKLNAYLLKHRGDGIWFAPRIQCADGFSLSVQVHEGAYCSPRDGYGPVWDTAEIGFPSDRPNDEVMTYAEEPEMPTQTVYGYVPLSVIEALIEEHGGFAEVA